MDNETRIRRRIFEFLIIPAMVWIHFYGALVLINTKLEPIWNGDANESNDD